MPPRLLLLPTVPATCLTHVPLPAFPLHLPCFLSLCLRLFDLLPLRVPSSFSGLPHLPCCSGVHGNGDPIVYGVMADFGMTNDISLNALLAEAESGAFDVFLHSGDLGETEQLKRACCCGYALLWLPARGCRCLPLLLPLLLPFAGTPAPLCTCPSGCPSAFPSAPLSLCPSAAYDLNNYGGSRGNDYMNALQPLAANIPYMTISG